MSGILRLESLTKGNTLKQGDKTPLKYRLFDADGEKLNIAGKSAQVRLVYPDFLTIGYEKGGLTVAQDDTVTFTIDGVIPSRIYHVEIIVDDKFIFPSRADEAKFTVDKSSLGTEANVIEIVGVDQIVNTVLGRVDADINQAVIDITTTNEAIQQAEQERVQGYQEIQQIIEDGALNAVPADGSLTTEKFAPDSVTVEKTEFIKKSSNLINPDKTVAGKVVSEVGVIQESDRYNYQDFIPVTPNTTYSSIVFNQVNYYDENHNPSGSDYITYSGAQFTTRENTHFVTLNYNSRLNNTEERRMNEGSELLPYEPFNVELDEGIRATPKDNSVDNKHIKRNAVGIDKVDFITQSTNLLNMESLTTGKVINSSGVLVDNASYATSDSIDVRNIDEVTSKYVHFLSWFKDEAFISRTEIVHTNTTTIQKPVGATTLIASVNTTISQFTDKIMQINAGDTLLPFEPYYLEIKNLKISDNTINETYDFEEYDQFIVQGDLNKFYKSGSLDGYLNLEYDLTTENLYGFYDDLVDRFPEYVSKVLLGMDSSGSRSVYKYTFKPTDVPTASDRLNQKRPKIILVSGIHGYEKTITYILYKTMEAICENWSSDEVLETLRWNVHFEIIPNANPSGFDTRSRTNFNGVDLARNFEGGWDLAEDREGGDGNIISKGSHPLSEVEAQYIDNVLSENAEDAILFSSLHNFSSNSNNPERFIWYASANKLQMHLGKELISELSRRWKKEYPWLQNDGYTYYGYADREAPYGSEGRQATLYGIQGGTFEISRLLLLGDDNTQASSNVVTMGVDALVNLFLLNLNHGVKYYNSAQIDKSKTRVE